MLKFTKLKILSLDHVIQYVWKLCHILKNIVFNNFLFAIHKSKILYKFMYFKPSIYKIKLKTWWGNIMLGTCLRRK